MFETIKGMAQVVVLLITNPLELERRINRSIENIVIQNNNWNPFS